MAKSALAPGVAVATVGFFLLKLKMPTLLFYHKQKRAYPKNCVMISDMNKDVVYIEPEDDITDILAKLAGAKAKIVALVPPKKVGALRSLVNIKLIEKTAKQNDKVAVLVTTDPTVRRLAASVRMPVAKNLQSRPEIPELDAEDETTDGEQVIDEDLGAGATDAAENPEAEAKSAKDAAKDGKDQKSAETDKTKGDKSKKVPDIKKYRKFIIAGAMAGVGIIGFLIWAFVFAPAATINVTIATTQTNFSGAVTLTTNQRDADVENGIFYAEQVKYEDTRSVEFTATGQEDQGERATGRLTLTYTMNNFNASQSFTVARGTTFTLNGKSFTTDEAVQLVVDSSCLSSGNCSASATVSITAVEAGSDYNLAPGTSWSSSVLSTGGDYSLTVTDNNGTSGGTSNIVTVVTQSDIDGALERLNSELSSVDGQAELVAQLSETDLAISDTFYKSTSDAVSSPAVGEAVTDGTVPTLSVTTTYTMFVVSSTDVETYLTSRTSLGDNQRIYSFGSPYFERVTTASDTTYSARLKATIYTGPEITEEEILEEVKGKRIGDARSVLRSIDGVSDVTIETSFFWVSSIPSNANKVTINLISDDEDTSDSTSDDESSEDDDT